MFEQIRFPDENRTINKEFNGLNRQICTVNDFGSSRSDRTFRKRVIIY